MENDRCIKSKSLKDINEMHIELEHPSGSMGKALDLKLTHTYKFCENCTLGKEERLVSAKRL